MKNRPWIWAIVAHLALIAGFVVLFALIKQHPQPEVPLTHQL